MTFEEVPITDHIDIVSPGVKPFSGKKMYVATGSLNTGKIIDAEEIDFETRPSRANMQPIAGDVMFAKMKDTEKVFLVSEEDSKNIYSTGFSVLRIKNKEHFMPEFLFYWLRSYYFQELKNKECTGATQKALNETKLEKFKIQKPTLKTQKNIVSLLAKAEKLVHLRKRANNLTGELSKAIFNEMFGNLERNTKKWEYVKMKDIIIGSPQNGLYKSSSDYVEGESGIPILRIDSFYDGRVQNLENLKRLKCDKKEIDLYGLAEEDIVINRVNSIEYLGKCAIINGLKESTVFESNIMRLKVDKTMVDPLFVTELLCSKFIYNQILKSAKKAVNQASINQKDVNNFEIPLPPLSLQQNFTGIIKKTEKLKEKQHRSNIQTEHLFNSLMKDIFNGDLIC